MRQSFDHGLRKQEVPFFQVPISNINDLNEAPLKIILAYIIYDIFFRFLLPAFGLFRWKISTSTDLYKMTILFIWLTWIRIRCPSVVFPLIEFLTWPTVFRRAVFFKSTQPFTFRITEVNSFSWGFVLICSIILFWNHGDKLSLTPFLRHKMHPTNLYC